MQKKKLDKKLFDIKEKGKFTSWTSKKEKFRGILLTSKFKNEFDVVDTSKKDNNKK